MLLQEEHSLFRVFSDSGKNEQETVWVTLTKILDNPQVGSGGVGGGYVYVETGRPNRMRTANLYIKVPMWTRRPRLTGRAARGRGSETGGKDPRILFCRR